MNNLKTTVTILEACVIPDCATCPLGKTEGNCCSGWVTVPKDYVEEAIDRLKQNAWISVTERLPKVDEIGCRSQNHQRRKHETTRTSSRMDR